MRQGIAIAGNIVVDAVKNIDRYPDKGMLSSISSMTRGVGGSVPNVGIDLRVIDPALPVTGMGRVGKDEHGAFVLNELSAHGIDTSRIKQTDTSNTSFSDVMNLPSGERTFFHYRGANAEFCPDDVELSSLDVRILHTAYILLLDRFDEEDSEYGTAMARFLCRAQRQGIETSVDMVSSSAGQYAQKALPALKYCDYFIVNEVECCGVWDISPRRADGALDAGAVKDAMRRTLNAGKCKKVIVHAKEAGFCLSRGGEFSACASLNLPECLIKGSVGAGDAFCAGALYGIYSGMNDSEMLAFASAAAASSLLCENAVDGMKDIQGIYELMRAHPRRELELGGIV